MVLKQARLFERLGRAIVRHKYLIIVFWIIILGVALPIATREGSVVSLNQGTTSGPALESQIASNIINSQFAKTVPNSSLVAVVESTNVSSIDTQNFINMTIYDIKQSSSVDGLQNISSVYSILYPILNETDSSTRLTFTSANKTNNLLLGVPALYVNVWVAAFNQTHNPIVSSQVAYNQSESTLKATNQTAFKLYSSHVLALFNQSWVQSFSTHPIQNATYSISQRAIETTHVADLEYVNTYMSAGSSRSFGFALVSSFNFTFVSENNTVKNSSLISFATNYVANESGFSTKFVSSAFSLGQNYTSLALETLAGNIVSNPVYYNATSDIRDLISSFVDSSRHTALISIGLNQSRDSNIVNIRSILKSNVAEDKSRGGTVASAPLTGSDAVSYDFGRSTAQDLGVILPVTIILLIVATGLFFRSALTPFITLGTIGVALGISQIFIVLVGLFIAKVDFTIPTILITIMIGVGTDYSVFVIARYREERVKGLDAKDAIVKSITWAGESIATSGATVIISFLALSLSSIVFLRTMGIVVGLGVLVALAVALTLIPAIVTIAAERTFWPNSGKRFSKYSTSVLKKIESKSGYFARSSRFSVKRAKLLVLLALVVTLPAAYVYFTTVPTYNFIGGAPNNLESIAASNLITSSFGEGVVNPTYVVMTFNSPIWNGSAFNISEMSVISSASRYLTSYNDIQNVTSPTSPSGAPISYVGLNPQNTKDNRTINSILSEIGSDKKTALITVSFRIDPYSTQAISDAQSIRNYLHSTYSNVNGTTGEYVGGASGSILDTKNTVGSQFTSILPIVALGVGLVLLVVLGSLFLPIFAVASILMGIVWSLAVTKIVFQALFNYQILFITPLFLFVTLLGLGMDYNIFILTRIREEAAGGQKLNDAIVHAIERTGGIITAAAIILAGSLASLMLSSDLLLKQIGFAFSFSILVDALVVRTYLVPAVMSVAGKWNWYNPIPLLRRSRALYEQEASKGS